MALIQIIVKGNNASGKSTVLAVIEKALLEHGFKDVVFVKPEESEDSRKNKLDLIIRGNPHMENAKIELIEQFGKIE